MCSLSRASTAMMVIIDPVIPMIKLSQGEARAQYAVVERKHT